MWILGLKGLIIYFFQVKDPRNRCTEGFYQFPFSASLIFHRENLYLLQFFVNADTIFAHILVSPACAIKVQHNNHNCSTVLPQRPSFLLSVSSLASQAITFMRHSLMYVFPSEPHTGFTEAVQSSFLGHTQVGVPSGEL